MRHNPASAGITLDERGSTDLNRVVKALKDTHHGWADKEEIKKLINKGEKQRFEITRGKIRALYGHSVNIKPHGEYEPSNNLYHGTSPTALKTIQEEGLKPMGRQFVHLSKNIDDAITVGKRHYPNPVVLKIDTIRASQEVTFYDKGNVVLAKKIPQKYITVIKDKQT